MWVSPKAKPTPFAARQTVSCAGSAYIWRAQMAGFLSMVVSDYLVAGIGGLEVRLLSVIPLATMNGGDVMNQGEALRYLAEITWNPDAIVENRTLDWTVVDPKTIKVATGNGAARGEMTFILDEQGLIISASAPARGYLENGKTTSKPWHGRFWNYQHIAGRLIPVEGEVAWTLDDGDFIYWRGRIGRWKGASSEFHPIEP